MRPRKQNIFDSLAQEAVTVEVDTFLSEVRVVSYR